MTTSPATCPPDGASATETRPGKPDRRILISLLLAAAIIAVFGQALGYGFVSIDDFEYVRDNPNVNSGLSRESLKWAFGHPVAGNWHPLTMLSHMLDCQIYGLHPWGHHLTNILLHTANTLLLFWVLLKMTEGTETQTVKGRSNFWQCTMVAALFAVHPLRVESVAWISERKDVLSGFFFMLTLWAYVRYVQAKTRSSALPCSLFNAQCSMFNYFLALFFFCLGLMSKPMLITLPCVLLLFDYWPLRRTGMIKLFLEKIPFFLLTAIGSLITFYMQKKAGAVVALEEFPLKARLANALVSYARYLGKTIWPDSLTVLYPQRSWAGWQVAAAVILLAALTLFALWTARRQRFYFVGWFMFAGMLLPVSGLVQAGEQAMADRFCYLPLIGIFLAVIRAVAQIPWRGILAQAGAILIAALMVKTSRQVSYWKDSKTLFAHVLQVSPDNSTAHHFLGVILLDSGDLNAAQQHFTQAVQFNPANVRARCALGYIFAEQGKLAESSEEYQAALRVEPASAKAHVGLAGVLARQGRPDLSVNHYALALQSNPNIAEAHLQLGSALLSGKQDPAQAIAYLQNAVRLAPDWPLALNALAWTLATFPDAKFRNGPEAIRLALRATVLAKDDTSMLDTLAAAYAEAGQFTDAIQTEETALQRAKASNQTKLAAELASHLQSFQAQRPWRE